MAKTKHTDHHNEQRKRHPQDSGEKQQLQCKRIFHQGVDLWIVDFTNSHSRRCQRRSSGILQLKKKKIYMHFYSNMKYRVFDGTLYERPKLIPRGLQEMHGKNIYIKRSM